MDQFKMDAKKVDQAMDANQLNLLRMVESRIVEIVQIENDVKKKYPKLFTQRLPRYMRRRAGSHNPYRIPKWLRNTRLTTRDRRKLYCYRQRLRFRKHKRILDKHARHRFKDPNKSLLHKWFAKRFKMDKKPQEGMEFVPLHNNTKNFRNLYRQTRYGCAFISMAHLVAFKVNSPYDTATIDALNELTRSVSGFTFAARALELGRYEVVIHLYETSLAAAHQRSKSSPPKKVYTHLCPAIVHNNKTHWTLWVPRVVADRVDKLLTTVELPHCRVAPRDAIRIRLVGPDAHRRAAAIALDPVKHEQAIEDVELRLMKSHKFHTTIGRYFEEKDASFTYYQTDPISVDVVFRNRRKGRMLWHQLVRNKAHLVGGKRDVDELLLKRYADCFQLKPDCE
uniref:Pop1 N-terminal domain-containing protein n=1 Tax=Aceria tosichella TaxID=561515 RepID=A0A6G1SGG1_9ACAR